MTACGVLNKGYHLFRQFLYKTQTRRCSVCPKHLPDRYYQIQLKGTRGCHSECKTTSRGNFVCIASRNQFCASALSSTLGMNRGMSEVGRRPSQLWSSSTTGTWGGGGVDLSDKKFVIWRQRGQLGGTGSRSSGILLDVAVLNSYEICKLSTPVALHMWGVEWGVREAGWKLECCVWRGPWPCNLFFPFPFWLGRSFMAPII